MDTNNVSTSPFTLQLLREAQDEVARLERAFDNYSGGNPKKHQSEIKSARSRAESIENYLKEIGTIPRTEDENLKIELDNLFPNADNKEVVEHNGKRYQRRFFPKYFSRSGKKVKEWAKKWQLLEV